MRRSLTAALLLCLAPAAAVAQTTCDSLVVTGHPAYPPVTWAAQGGLVGAAPDLAASIGRQLGLKVVFRDFGSWEKAIAAAQEGQADLILGIYQTSDRAKTLDFVQPPFLLDPNAVAVRQGAAFPFSSWAELKGRKGVTNAAESFGEPFDTYQVTELTLARAPGVKEAFEALMSGKADYLLIGLYPGRMEAKRLGLAGKVEFLPKPLSSADMFVAFSKKSRCSPAQRVAFAGSLKDAVASGEVKVLLEKAEASSR